MIKALLALAPLLFVPSCSSPPPASAIEVRDAWARATAPGQASGAVYATIVNRGGADRLTGAASERAAMAMLHSNIVEGGVSRMRMLDEVEIPAGSSVALAPGATHVMLDRLTAPLVAGEQVALTLRFANAGPRQVSATVVAPGAR